MKPRTTLNHEFVRFIPNDLEEGTVYISIEFATAAHRCCCGCGNKIVTPISPTDWKLLFDGETISLDPSIGNWSFPCQSHYWIKRNRVKWARQWSQEEINAGRMQDSGAKERYYESTRTLSAADTVSSVKGRNQGKLKKSFWQRFKKWFS